MSDNTNSSKEEQHIREDNVKKQFKHQKQLKEANTKTSKENPKEKISKEKKEETEKERLRESQGETHEEVTLDLNKLQTSLSKLKNIKIGYITAVLVLIALFLSIYFRMYPQWLPITDDWARQTVENSVKNQIALQISTQYQYLPKEQRDKIINSKFEEIYKANKAQFDKQVKSTSNYFKSRMKYEYDNKSTTYLLAIDPYFYYRYARNILRHGHPGDFLKNGTPWNALTIAPFGFAATANFHVYIEVFLYKVFNIFGNFDLMHSSFFLPIIISALSVFPAFFIGRKFGGNLAGFIAALVVALHPAFIGRTAGGFADTDSYNVTMPLWITWLFLEALSARSWKKLAILSITSGVLIGLYTRAWAGWWYIFDFLLVAVIAIAAWSFLRVIIQQKKQNQNKIFTPLKKDKYFYGAIITGVLLIVSSLITSTIAGTNVKYFVNAPLQPIQFRTIKNPAKQDLWPNVYTTVAELNPASINTIISTMSWGGGNKRFYYALASLGAVLAVVGLRKLSKIDLAILAGSFIWFLILTSKGFIGLGMLWLILYALPGVLVLLISLKLSNTDLKEKSSNIELGILLLIWVLATIYASTKGVRFTLLAVPAFGVSLGIVLGGLYYVIKKYLVRDLKIPTRFATVILLLITLSLLILPVKAANQSAKGEVPSMTDAWFETLTNIKNNSSKNAIITSWWDFGHWFKAIAERPVTFDGGSQNTPMAHWVGKLLLTNNENLSLGILRMLDCGSNTAFEELNNYYKDTLTTIKELYKILPLNKEQARSTLLQDGIPEQVVNEVIKRSHCKPPEAFLITSKDMVGKAGVWAHFGSWDFEKAWAYLNVKGKPAEEGIQLLQDKLNLSEDKATSMYYEIQSLSSGDQANAWISPWPNYLTQSWKGCSRNNKTIICNFNAAISRQQQGILVLEKAEINLKTHNVKASLYLLNPQTNTRSDIQEASFGKIVISENNSLYSIENKNASLGIGLVLDADNNRVLITSQELADSMFTRLFYLEGVGTRHFQKFSDKTTFTGLRIIVWKVKW